MKEIRVLEVIRQGKIGGGESHLLDLIDSFDNKKVIPIVLSFSNGQMIEKLTQKSITCYVIETSLPFDIRIIKEINNIIKKENIQLIHAHGSRAASNMVITSIQTKTPMIYTVHGWSFHNDQPKVIFKLRALSEKFICSISKEVICVSQSNYNSGKKAFGLKKATIIENGVNLRRFDPKAKHKNIRNEFGFNDEDFIIGFIGRCTIQKAPIDFVKSINIANKKISNIKGLFIGEGEMDDKVLKEIERLKLQKTLIKVGFREDIPDILNAINVFCLPSLWEGLSISLLEAMAMKKAIVATSTDGTKDVINDGVNGIIVNFNKPNELAESYIKFYNQKDLYNHYSENAYELVKSKFSSNVVSELVTNIYIKYMS